MTPVFEYLTPLIDSAGPCAAAVKYYPAAPKTGLYQPPAAPAPAAADAAADAAANRSADKLAAMQVRPRLVRHHSTRHARQCGATLPNNSAIPSVS